MEKLVCYTDGGARGNPGPSGIGVVVTDGEKILFEYSKFLGPQTNNFAEYEAVITLLAILEKKFAAEIKVVPVEVRLDSELVVRQLGGIYRVKEETLKRQFQKVAELRANIPQIIFTHVRREKNKDADRLANEAMDGGK